MRELDLRLTLYMLKTSTKSFHGACHGRNLFLNLSLAALSFHLSCVPGVSNMTAVTPLIIFDNEHDHLEFISARAKRTDQVGILEHSHGYIQHGRLPDCQNHCPRQFHRPLCLGTSQQGLQRPPLFRIFKQSSSELAISFASICNSISLTTTMMRYPRTQNFNRKSRKRYGSICFAHRHMLVCLLAVVDA